MGKNLTSISGTSGPPHPLQSTIQPILGVLEQFWPKNLAEQANPTASLVNIAVLLRQQIGQIGTTCLRKFGFAFGAEPPSAGLPKLLLFTPVVLANPFDFQGRRLCKWPSKDAVDAKPLAIVANSTRVD